MSLVASQNISTAAKGGSVERGRPCAATATDIGSHALASVAVTYTNVAVVVASEEERILKPTRYGTVFVGLFASGLRTVCDCCVLVL